MSKSGFIRGLLGATLAGALALGLPGSPARAADASDIPGVPLPGPVATGRLGGPIFDVVYRLTVAPGSVIVAGLTGTAGTDFDLYLFDASATTVQSNVGLVARSTGPTSSESISFPSPFGGTYYLDLHGATDVQGDYRLVVQMVPDQTPPTVSMVLAGGRPATNQLTVPAALSAADDLSGVAEMAFSADGAAWTEWAPFERSATWTFTVGDGPRTLWAKVRNGAGLESAPTSATVTIDTVQPAANALIPAPGSTVVGLRPTFAVTFDEPMDPASWSSFGLIVQAATGVLVPGDYTYDAARRTGSFVPSTALVAGATYIVTIGSVTDVAGNRPAPRGSWTVITLAPTSVAARATPSVLTFGGSSRVDLTLTGAPMPAGLMVEARPASSTTWTVLTTLLVQGGRAALTVAPDRTTVYRFSYAGGGGFAPAQVEMRLRVRRSVTFVGAAAAAAGQARVGRPVQIVATLGPAAPRTAVSFRLYRFDTVRRQWVFAGSRGRNSDAAGRVSLTWTPTSSGAFYWRVAVPATADHSANLSAVSRWSVTR
ncbi:MAG TPA: Ig-like domain-containing protein [Patescibacteria group bacterium]|nr:Ig-like domain-containing protein [Patescibacteria group bacterium]